MKKWYNLSELIVDGEDQKKWIGNIEDIKSIATPDGHELTKEEMFDFVIGDSMNLSKDNNKVDIGIVLGSLGLKTTRERAIKAFELYKLGRVKRIIFTGGISKTRDKKGFMHPETLEEYMSNELTEDLEWQDFTEADWGSLIFNEETFDEDYQKHIQELTDEFISAMGINPEDVLIEPMSSSTQENAECCKNIFDAEEVETGTKVKTAMLITTCTHGNRATRQFKKIFGDKIDLTWCPSTLDLEAYEPLKNILRDPNFNKSSFIQELKKLYCETPELTYMLKKEIVFHRDAFNLGYIDEPKIECQDKERDEDSSWEK